MISRRDYSMWSCASTDSINNEIGAFDFFVFRFVCCYDVGERKKKQKPRENISEYRTRYRFQFVSAGPIVFSIFCLFEYTHARNGVPESPLTRHTY